MLEGGQLPCRFDRKRLPPLQALHTHRAHKDKGRARILLVSFEKAALHTHPLWDRARAYAQACN